jgi:DCN1-like protein 1/2
MPKLSQSQKSLLDSFVRVTNSNAKTAMEYLSSSSWNLEQAVNHFLSNAGPRVDEKALRNFYLKYEDKERKKIMAEGIIALCDDIGVDPQDVVMLVICWHMQAVTMGEFSREEFEEGMQEIGVDSPDALKATLPFLRSELNDKLKFREIYEYSFLFSRENGQKCVQLDVALSIWPLLITTEKWKHIESWCDFLRIHHKRAVSKDTWMQLLDFINIVDEEFTEFDPNGAWPYLIDEFVAFKQKEKQQNFD